MIVDGAERDEGGDEERGGGRKGDEDKDKDDKDVFVVVWGVDGK